MPGSLDKAIDALEANHEFLLKGGVFTEGLIETWIDYKRREERDPVRHPAAPWSSRSTTTSEGAVLARLGRRGATNVHFATA